MVEVSCDVIENIHGETPVPPCGGNSPETIAKRKGIIRTGRVSGGKTAKTVERSK
jgi:hypothetical protein